MKMIIKRIIVEIRFIPILRFKEFVYDYFQGILEEYTGLRDDSNVVELIHDRLSKKIFCERQRAGIAVENIDDMTTFNVEVQKLMKLLEACKVSHPNRLGVRSWFLTTMPELSYQDSVKRYANHQLQMDHMALGPPDFEDFAVTLEGTVDMNKVRIQSGVVNKDEIIASHSEFAYEDDPNVAFLHDIDVCRLDPDYPFKSKLIIDMVDIGRNIANKFAENSHDLFDSR